jgi:hypothetical protein
MTEKTENQTDTRPDHGGGAVATAAHPPRPASRVADLTTSKVVAGGMAAATSAVFGSHFGVFGTVGGAAVGSVVTTVGTNLYQRSLERARDRVARQIPLPATFAGRTGPTADAVPTAGIGAVGSRASTSFPLGRVLRMSLVGALVFFGLGLGLVTGIEWAKGSPLSGGTRGTTVGAALSPARVTAPATVPELQDPESSEPAPSAVPDSKQLEKAQEKAEKERAKANKDVPAPDLPITPSTPLPQPSAPLPQPSTPLPLPLIGFPGR